MNKVTARRYHYLWAPVVAVLLFSAGEAARADSFRFYFSTPGTHFGYDSGHRQHGYKDYYRGPRHYKRYYKHRYRHGYGHRYGHSSRHWKQQRYWNGRRHYRAYRPWHHYPNRRYYGHRRHGWSH